MAKKERITIRLDVGQLQCLKELKDKLSCSYSLMVRTIISDFLTKNEDILERIIDGEKEEIEY